MLSTSRIMDVGFNVNFFNNYAIIKYNKCFIISNHRIHGFFVFDVSHNSIHSTKLNNI